LAAYTVEMPLPKAPLAISDPGQYIQYLFQFGFYLIAFLAVGMITYGGVLYMIPSKIAEAKERIWGAVIGVVFLLCSFLILKTIDPNLLNLSPELPAQVGTLNAGNLPVIGVDYGVNETATTRRFIFDGIENPAYGTEEGCRSLTQLAAFKDRLISDGYLFTPTTKECVIVTRK
jgi:hypothetical protein